MNHVAQPGWEDAVRWLRAQPDSAELVRDCYYDDPLIVAAQRYWQSEEWADVRRLIAPITGRALDLGAGRGIASYALARDGFTVTALEPDPSDLVGAGAIRELARAAGLVIALEQHAALPLPFADATFDLVFARAALHHLPDLAAALAECHRLLRPGGRLLAVREHVITRRADLPTFLDRHPLHHRYGGENAYLLAEYRDAIKRAGFVHTRCLNPLESPVNYAPHTRASLVAAIATRLPGLGTAARAALEVPGVGGWLLTLAGRIDRRPGRLFSFVATR